MASIYDYSLRAPAIFTWYFWLFSLQTWMKILLVRYREKSYKNKRTETKKINAQIDVLNLNYHEQYKNTTVNGSNTMFSIAKEACLWINFLVTWVRECKMTSPERLLAGMKRIIATRKNSPPTRFFFFHFFYRYSNFLLIRTLIFPRMLRSNFRFGKMQMQNRNFY